MDLISLEDFSHLGLIDGSAVVYETPKRERKAPSEQRRWPPLRCPRCSSTNTKFCYYNNHSQSQPRYLCKACRRHWTEGGALRNVPFGGGRKNKQTKAKTKTKTVAVPTVATAPAAVASTNTSTSGAFPEILRQVFLPLPEPQTAAAASSSVLGSHGSTPAALLWDHTAVMASSSDGWPVVPPMQIPASIGGDGVFLEPFGGYWSGWDDDVVAGLMSAELKPPTGGYAI